VAILSRPDLPAAREKDQERSRTKAALSGAKRRCLARLDLGAHACKALSEPFFRLQLGVTRLVWRRLRRLLVGVSGHVGSLGRWGRVIRHRSRLFGRRLLRLVGRLWLLSSSLFLHRH
jgi:hypothetical protein